MCVCKGDFWQFCLISTDSQGLFPLQNAIERSHWHLRLTQESNTAVLYIYGPNLFQGCFCFIFTAAKCQQSKKSCQEYNELNQLRAGVHGILRAVLNKFPVHFVNTPSDQSCFPNRVRMVISPFAAAYLIREKTLRNIFPFPQRTVIYAWIQSRLPFHEK